MVNQTQVRQKLQDQLFNKYGKTVTLIKKSSPVYNDRGEVMSETSTSSTITIVPYNITSKNLSQEEMGNLNEGTLQAAVPYDVSVDIGDVLTIESENWNITGIEPNYLPDNVVTIVSLVRQQA